MHGKALLEQLRRLCCDIDAGRPLRPLRLGRVACTTVGPAAVAFALGTAGCGAQQQEPTVESPSPDAAPMIADASNAAAGDAGTLDADTAMEDTTPAPPAPVLDCSDLPPPIPAPTAPDVAARPGSTPPRVTVPEARVMYGIGFERPMIQRVVRRHNRQLRACYETRLAEHPELTGRVTVRWTIAISGEVTQAEVVSSTLNDDEAERCVVCRVQRMRFPEPRTGGEVVVTYPFDFERSR